MSTRVCAVSDLASGEARRFEVEGKGVALVRVGDDFHAIGDRCSHANVSLSEGEVHVEDCTLECWKHGSAFSLVTGEPTTLPATRAVPVYDVALKDDEVWVTIS